MNHYSSFTAAPISKTKHKLSTVDQKVKRLRETHYCESSDKWTSNPCPNIQRNYKKTTSTTSLNNVLPLRFTNSNVMFVKINSKRYRWIRSHCTQRRGLEAAAGKWWVLHMSTSHQEPQSNLLGWIESVHRMQRQMCIWKASSPTRIRTLHTLYRRAIT